MKRTLVTAMLGLALSACLAAPDEAIDEAPGDLRGGLRPNGPAFDLYITD